MGVVRRPPGYRIGRATGTLQSIPKHVSRQLVLDARELLLEYYDSTPGGKGQIKHKLHDLVADLDHRLHKGNLQVRDQHFVVNAGELAGHHVHWN